MHAQGEDGKKMRKGKKSIKFVYFLPKIIKKRSNKITMPHGKTRYKQENSFSLYTLIEQIKEKMLSNFIQNIEKTLLKWVEKTQKQKPNVANI